MNQHGVAVFSTKLLRSQFRRIHDHDTYPKDYVSSVNLDLVMCRSSGLYFSGYLGA